MKKTNILHFFKKNPEYIIVLPFLSVLFIFFYLTFFCRGEHFMMSSGTILLDTFTPYVIALLSILFAGLFLYYKKVCSLQFVIWYLILTAISFSIVQYLTFFTIYSKINTQIITFWIIGILSITATTVKIIYERFVLKNCWMLLFLVFQLLSLLIGNVFLVILTSSISIGILSSSKLSNIAVKKRVWFTCGSIIVYIVITISYMPYNPIWSLSNVYSVGISFKPLRSTIIIEDKGKFRIYSGQSITKTPLTDIEFDRVQSVPPFVFNKYVGLKCRINNPAMEPSAILDSIEQPLYPIAVLDSCAFFAADVSVFNELSKLRDSEDKLDKITADLFFKYLDYFYLQNDSSHEELKTSYLILQKELNRYIEDSTSTAKQDAGTTDYLRNCSKNISLGLLNACGYDLLNNNANLSALKLFSIQFLLTFKDSQYIYQGMRNIINGIDLADLEKDNNMTPWTKLFKVICTIAETCTTHNALQSILSLSDNLNNTTLINAIKESNMKDHVANVNRLRDNLSNYEYENNTMIRQYIQRLQIFLLKKIDQNFLPDYNSYFLNRLTNISRILIMNQESISFYDSLSEKYKNQFTIESSELQEAKNQLDTVLSLYSSKINIIESFQKPISRKLP